MSFTVEVDSGKVGHWLDEILAVMTNATPMMRAIASDLEYETEQNFQSQGRPRWLPLHASTEAARLKKGKGRSVLMILQDSGILAASLSTDYGPDFVQIGSNVPYAAIHQFGGTTRPHVIRPKDKKALAFGSKGKETVVKQVNHPGSKIPARPFMLFTGPPEAVKLQPEAERTILDTISRMLNRRAP
ncbi:MAG: phage virion morphogenesis protein [Betaproteobacteria bacterium]|nr:phage virion morphogenesis protein [Betaproteobacteria bacterium]